MVKCRPMKFARTDRSLIAWMLYCCVLFNVFACSIGHGQMVGMQLNGIGGQFCTVDPRTQSEIGIGYSSLVEAQAEAVKLEQVGYKILRISPMTLPKPNS